MQNETELQKQERLKKEAEERQHPSTLVNKNPPQTVHEQRAAEAIASANKQAEVAKANAPKTSEKALEKTFTSLDIEPDTGGVKIVVVRDNQVTLVVGMGLPEEAITPVVNALTVLKSILGASREEINRNFNGLVRR